MKFVYGGKVGLFRVKVQKRRICMFLIMALENGSQSAQFILELAVQRKRIWSGQEKVFLF